MRVNPPLIIEGNFALSRRCRADRGEENDHGPAPTAPVSSSRVPRIARLLALAWHIDGLVRAGWRPSNLISIAIVLRQPSARALYITRPRYASIASSRLAEG
jgi:hypothetical protein